MNFQANVDFPLTSFAFQMSRRGLIDKSEPIMDFDDFLSVFCASIRLLSFLDKLGDDVAANV